MFMVSSGMVEPGDIMMVGITMLGKSCTNDEGFAQMKEILEDMVKRSFKFRWKGIAS